MKDLNLPFYLTGGTALSRFYYNHRYSDDLEFFVNGDPNFMDYVRLFLEYFTNPSPNIHLKINIERVNISEKFSQLFVYEKEIELKVDFVNDLAVRYYNVIKVSPLGRVDSIRNILSNKISALYRFEIKDYVDIWCIAKNYKFNWRNLINESKQKEAAVDPVEIYNLFKSFPFENLDAIKWCKPVDYNEIKANFFSIAEDILRGCNNSLT